MARKARGIQATRRIGRRYTITLFLALALIGGWGWLWHFAAGKAQQTIDGWRAREAKAGRVYTCGAETIGGFPFQIEVNCDKASASFHSSQPPAELKTPRIVAGVQVYDPTRVVSDFTGPLMIGEPGHTPTLIANWKQMQSSVRGTPAAPQQVSIEFDRPTLDQAGDAGRQRLLNARRIDINGRIVEGSAARHPVIETVLRLRAASAPGLHPAAVQPIDADITAVLRGLDDFSPKSWAARFRQVQAAGGRIDITKARVQQGETLAIGEGTLSLNGNGRLDGQLRVTVAGIEPFLAAIGAQRTVQQSQPMDKLAGTLNRLAPGLGDVARAQAGANLSFGLNLLGEQTTLEGRRAVSLPLRFSDGSVYLGPIQIGSTPALF
jgi:hypothetical protein